MHSANIYNISVMCNYPIYIWHIFSLHTITMLQILIYTYSYRTAALLQGILEAIKAEIDTTTNATTMMRLCESKPYDYIISDDLDYFVTQKDIARTLRRGNTRQPRIYIIGNDNEALRACMLLANGIDQYISQPILPSRLLSKVEAL